MSLILALGSNLGDREKNLQQAIQEIEKFYCILACSNIYESSPVDLLEQPDFLNQVLELSTPAQDPLECLTCLQKIENDLGRSRLINKGPRIIDIDIIFWDRITLQNPKLIIPHPSWSQRSFVVKPLQELPAIKEIEKYYEIPDQFSSDASPLYKA